MISIQTDPDLQDKEYFYTNLLTLNIGCGSWIEISYDDAQFNAPQ